MYYFQYQSIFNHKYLKSGHVTNHPITATYIGYAIAAIALQDTEVFNSSLKGKNMLTVT